MDGRPLGTSLPQMFINRYSRAGAGGEILLLLTTGGLFSSSCPDSSPAAFHCFSLNSLVTLPLTKFCNLL